MFSQKINHHRRQSPKVMTTNNHPFRLTSGQGIPTAYADTPGDEYSTIKKRHRPSTSKKMRKQSSQKEDIDFLPLAKVRIEIGEKKTSLPICEFQKSSTKEEKTPQNMLNSTPKMNKTSSILPK